MSDAAEKPRDVPEPVQTALSVLEDFKKASPAKRRALKRKLPALAMHMAEAGEDVTADKLRDIADGGVEAIEALQSRFVKKDNRQERTYDSVIESLGLEPVEDPPQGFDESRYETPVLALAFAAEAGRADIVERLIKEDPERVHDAFVSYGVNQAALKGDFDMVRLLADAGADLHYADDAIMRTALMGGNMELVDWLEKEQGFDFAAYADTLLVDIASHPDSEAGVACLLEHGPSQKAKNEALAAAAKFHKPGAADLLIQDGAEPASVDKADQRAILPRIERYRLWLQVQHRKPPQSLSDYNPYLFRPNIYADVNAMMKREGHDDYDGRMAAAHAATLFGSTDRVLRFLERWGAEDSKSPLFDLCRLIRVPQETRTDLKAWGDAVLKHGPRMARLVRFADRIEKPGSLVETGQMAAKLSYARADEEIELAGHCLSNGVDEAGFNAALDMKQEVDKIPAEDPDEDGDTPDEPGDDTPKTPRSAATRKPNPKP